MHSGNNGMVQEEMKNEKEQKIYVLLQKPGGISTLANFELV